MEDLQKPGIGGRNRRKAGKEITDVLEIGCVQIKRNAI